MKHCGHEKVCEQCTREQIAKLEKQISALKAKLPAEKIVYIERNNFVPYNPMPLSPVPMPIWIGQQKIDHNMVYCKSTAVPALC